MDKIAVEVLIITIKKGLQNLCYRQGLIKVYLPLRIINNKLGNNTGLIR